MLSNYKQYGILQLSPYQILLFVHKFTHHRHKLPDVCTSYFTQNSSIHHHDIELKATSSSAVLTLHLEKEHHRSCIM